MTTTRKHVGRRGSFARGAQGESKHAEILTDMGYPARARPQASGLGRLQQREIRRLMRAYDCSEAEADTMMRAAGSAQAAPTDLDCPLLEPVAHLESKFYAEPQWTSDTTMLEWEAQVHRDARPHQLPVVLHSWADCREPLVIVFPRRSDQGWHFYRLSEWILTLERSGYVQRDPRGQPITDADGRPVRATLRPVAGAATPDKARALLTIHPRARRNAARWARECGGDYVAGAAAEAREHARRAQWWAQPETQRAWLDHLRVARVPGAATLDDLHQVSVNGRRYNLGALHPVVHRDGAALSFVPGRTAVSHGLAPDGARDYARPRSIRVFQGHAYDLDDVELVRDEDGHPRRSARGRLVWGVRRSAQPIALASTLAWLQSR